MQQIETELNLNEFLRGSSIKRRILKAASRLLGKDLSKLLNGGLRGERQVVITRAKKS